MKQTALTAIACLSALLVAGCGDDAPATDAAVSIDARPDQGTLSLSWAISDEQQNALACEDIAAVTVGISAFAEGAGSGVPLAFPCGDGTGTADLGIGNYRVEVQLRAGVGTLDGPVVQNGVVISKDQDTDIGEIAFEVLPEGGFEFALDTPFLGGNCEDGEGDITELTFELHDDTDTCVPTTFEIADGADTNGGTYQSDCQGASWGCIAGDQDISVSGVSSGEHTLVITGARSGVADCYGRNAQITIPGNDLVRDLPTQQLMLVSTPECDPNAPDAGVMPPDAGADAMP